MTENYTAFLTEIKDLIKSGQAKAALSVNASLISMYWNIGAMIAENQAKNLWGNNVIEQLATDLKSEFPGVSGFSRANLFFIRRFYLFYADEKVQQACKKKPTSANLANVGLKKWRRRGSNP